MLDIGFQELLIVMVIALLVFGPYKLPELGRALGRAMREFRRASDEFRSTIETNLNLNEETILPPSAAPGESTAAPTPTTEPDGTGAEIAASPEPPPLGAAGAESGDYGDGEPRAPLEPFWGQRGGRLLHRSACGWATRIPEADRVVFKTAGEGRDAGLSACPVCDPRDEAV